MESETVKGSIEAILWQVRFTPILLVLKNAPRLRLLSEIKRKSFEFIIVGILALRMPFFDFIITYGHFISISCGRKTDETVRDTEMRTVGNRFRVSRTV
jgi:hypothetical protein